MPETSNRGICLSREFCNDSFTSQLYTWSKSQLRSWSDLTCSDLKIKWPNPPICKVTNTDRQTIKPTPIVMFYNVFFSICNHFQWSFRSLWSVDISIRKQPVGLRWMWSDPALLRGERNNRIVQPWNAHGLPWDCHLSKTRTRISHTKFSVF